MATMDQNQAIPKARQFARMRYTGETENIVREHEQKRVELRGKLNSRGLLMSSAMINESARIDGEQIKAITQSRIDATLEGYELYGVEIGDQMAIDMCDDVVQGMKQMAYNSKCPTFGGSTPSGLESQYPRMVEQTIGLSANLIKTQIDRRRLMAKKQNSPTTNYYVQGENARVNVNSTDHSVNIVMKSREEFFAAIRQRIESGVSDPEKKGKILNALAAMEESHGKPSFAQRYTELIGTAADHLSLLTPFIPALTEMLSRVLK